MTGTEAGVCVCVALEDGTRECMAAEEVVAVVEALG